MAAPMDRLWFLDVRAATDWMQGARDRLVSGQWGIPNLPITQSIRPATSRLLANARAILSQRAEQLLDDVEAQGTHVVSGLAEEASRLLELMAARLRVASRDDLIALRQRLTQIERKLDRFARQSQDHPPHEPGADPGEVLPPLPP